MKIWIASFIPKNISGYTKNVPDGSGRTMIPGPTLVSDCYLTDQRPFSDVQLAECRMRLAIDLDVASLSIIGEQAHCDNTVEVDCEDGDEECNKTPDSSALKTQNSRVSGDLLEFDIVGGAGNPCAGSLAPNIDWNIKVRVKRNSDVSADISLADGSLVEPFPAFEMVRKLERHY